MSGSERPGGTLLALVRAAETGPGPLRAVRTQIQRTHQRATWAWASSRSPAS